MTKAKVTVSSYGYSPRISELWMASNPFVKQPLNRDHQVLSAVNLVIWSGSKVALRIN